MSQPSFKSIAEQVADHLRGGIDAGRWRGEMPGAHGLAEELKVNFKVVLEAFQLLEQEGLLVSQGRGRRRKILAPKHSKPRGLRVGVLHYESDDRKIHYHADLKQRLDDAGHLAHVATKTLLDLGMNAERVANYVSHEDVDAWIVSGGSPDVLKWFSEQTTPAFALFGRPIGLPLPSVSPRKAPAMEKALQKLVAMGHKRIVLLCRDERRKPNPGVFEQAFLDELERLGIETSRYHLPDWDDHKHGLIRCVDSLFKITPPTALIVDEPKMFPVVQQHLARRGIYAPEHLSMICGDPNPVFAWCEPEIAHFIWDENKVIGRVIEWVNHIAHGKEDRVRTLIEAMFVEGGTIGPPPK